MYKTLIVVDDEELLQLEYPVEAISFDNYLTNYPKKDEPKTRIINLCDTENYLSKGYYCSLLAEARCHDVLPSVKTINEIRNLNGDDEALIPYKSDLGGLQSSGDIQEFFVYFGMIDVPALQKLATRIFNRYSAPLLKLKLNAKPGNFSVAIERYCFSKLDETQRAAFIKRLFDFTHTAWRIGKPKKSHRWDMAILVNPEEIDPPSDRGAITRFVKAAEKNGIHADVVSISEIQNIASYDALFIREKTAIDHYTYRLACKAEAAGLVVMDDPTSILRCCNKVFLHDAFSYQQVPSLKTQVIASASDATLDQLEATFGYPLVLKMPEGSFSRGVYKVKDRAELKEKLDYLFKDSALVLAQEYMYTEYDWRIGVLNGRAIFACRYLMAKNHWQIYNHNAKRFTAGDFETLPTFEVPKCVLDAALKSARTVGNGLYGVDIKQNDKHAYVLEVNDNPNIDYRIEDLYLGDELYMQIMAEFQRRLEARGR